VLDAESAVAIELICPASPPWNIPMVLSCAEVLRDKSASVGDVAFAPGVDGACKLSSAVLFSTFRVLLALATRVSLDVDDDGTEVGFVSVGVGVIVIASSVAASVV